MGNGRFRSALALASTLLALAVAPVAAEVFNGVDFPQGVASFADEIVDFNCGGGGATSGNPDRALGPPDFQSGPGRPTPSLSAMAARSPSTSPTMS